MILTILTIWLVVCGLMFWDAIYIYNFIFFFLNIWVNFIFYVAKSGDHHP